MTLDTKEALRAYYLKKRLELSQERVKEASKKILDQLKELKVFKEASNVAIYFPIKNEIDVTELIKVKRLLLPRVANRDLIFSYVSSYDSLLKSKFGINEPDQSQQAIDKAEIDLIIVPGIVFSKNKKRIGYGAGFYDLFLKDYKGTSIGVCFSEFIVDFQSSDYDIACDILMEG
ncbi:MAG: 5-formyltetrahydrofolate cyclo-ligase [Erysipelotrichales bacterium]|nr:5-formyltetrahydrofolate cyclo-ligase [Erysipelotrichales bacterium]